MSKSKQIKTFEFTTEFASNLRLLKGLKFDWDEMKTIMVWKHFSVQFNLWQVSNPQMKMDTTITKPTLNELERALLNFLK